MTPEEVLKRVLYKDANIIIFDKPAGIPVHSGPKGGENLEQYFDLLKFGYERKPALAHRLDRDTSGCLILGRNRNALNKLGKLFSSGKITKTYWAVTTGTPPQNQGTIDLALAKRSENKSSWWMEVSEKGVKAVTEYKVLGRGTGLSWLELKPKTGRTHQIRVHLAAINCPIIGDSIYGKKGDMSDKLCLHARSVEIPFYKDAVPLIVTANLPEYMASQLTKLR